MQTATLSRRLRNSVVTKGRCRQAPRQRVASHNTPSCWRPARRCAPAALPIALVLRRAHPCARYFGRIPRCAWMPSGSSARSSATRRSAGRKGIGAGDDAALCAIAAPWRSPGASPSGLRPDTPSALEPSSCQTHGSGRSRQSIPAEAEPDNRDATRCLTRPRAWSKTCIKGLAEAGRRHFKAHCSGRSHCIQG